MNSFFLLAASELKYYANQKLRFILLTESCWDYVTLLEMWLRIQIWFWRNLGVH